MFTALSNVAFNNMVFRPRTIPAMAEREMHASAARLYQAAKALKNVEGQSAVAVLLGESPQNMTNWEKRGVSNQGALKAQAVIGCSALWVSTGQGSMTEKPLSPAVAELAAAIDAIQDKEAHELAMDALKSAVRTAQKLAAANRRSISQPPNDGYIEDSQQEANGIRKR